MTGAVYRFFDTATGTHFLTSDLGERNNILNDVHNLVEETNGFGDVTPSDPNAQTVYRFFDTTLGTHFYTGDQTEFAGLTKAGSSTYRPDPTYEGMSFYAPAGSYK